MPVLQTQPITPADYRTIHTSPYSYGVDLWPRYITYWTGLGNAPNIAYYQAKLLFDATAQQSVYAAVLRLGYNYFVPDGAVVTESYNNLNGIVSLIVTG